MTATLTSGTEDHATGHAQAQRTFEALFESSGHGQVLLDPQTGRFLRVNQRFCALTGYAEDELLARVSSEITHPEDIAGDRAAMGGMLREGKSFTHEKRYLHKDGRVIWALVTAALVCDGDGKPLHAIVTIVDITEHKQTERALRESQDKLRLIVDNAPALISYINQDFRYELANDVYRQWFGHDSEAMRGRHVVDVLGPSAWDAVRPYMKRALAGETVTYEQKMPYRDGGAREVRVTYTPHRDRQGCVRGFVTLVHDVSEQHRSEQQLRQAREQLELVMNSTPAMVARCSSSGHFVWVNRSYAARFGLTPDEVAGKSLKDVLGDEILSALTPHIERVLSGQTCEFELEVPYKSGVRWMSVVYAPIFEGNSRPGGWVAVLTDQSRRRELERALRESEERTMHDLQEGSRRKDEFLAMLSHELRNPLAPILNAVELLRQLGGTDTRLGRFHDVIARQVRHMKRLLDDLLDVARVSQGKIQLRRELVDLAEALKQAVEVSRPLAIKKQQTLSLLLPNGPLPVNGDLTRLVQVFSNLLNNAVKYTDSGGEVRVTAACQDDLAVVRVRDTGLGMSRDMMARAFDLFAQGENTLDRSQGGLGVGLTLVRTLVTLHGGSVAADSEGPGHGSEFTVRLPLAEPRFAGAGPPARLADAARRPLRVLVVDDNRDAAESLQSLLDVLGHDADVAYDGVGAVEAALRTRPHLVLLDIGLPGIDGYEAARRIREAGLTSTRIVALTGYGREEDRSLSHKAGFDRHLVKPVPLSTLRALIAEMSVAAGR